MKRDVTDKYYSLAVKRIRSEAPDAPLANSQLEAIWFTINGMVERGTPEQEILEYVNNAKIREEKKHRGV